jgi:hypothetical protein
VTTGLLSDYCCAFFEIESMLVIRGTEYWLEGGQPRPDWRSKLVEYY